MSSYKPPYARMRQIRRDCVRPEAPAAPEAPAVPANVEAALALLPEDVFIVEVEQPAEAVAEANEPPVAEESLPDEPEAEESPAEPAEVAAEEEAAPEVAAPEVAPAPSKLVFSSQMNKSALIAVALSAGWEVPADMSRSSILAELTKMNLNR